MQNKQQDEECISESSVLRKSFLFPKVVLWRWVICHGIEWLVVLVVYIIILVVIILVALIGLTLIIILRLIIYNPFSR